MTLSRKAIIVSFCVSTKIVSGIRDEIESNSPHTLLQQHDTAAIPTTEILNFPETPKEDPGMRETDQYLEILAGNLTNHVPMARACEDQDKCFSGGGPSKVKHAARLVREAYKNGVVGDFVETGVCWGGVSIMARMAQRATGNSGLRTYACDSYEGLPHASTKDDDDIWANIDWMKVGVNKVRGNFARFNALDSQVFFVKGYFQSSLPLLRQRLKDEGRQIAVLRGDGDMFESYQDLLYNLYEFVPVGGYFICDDCSHLYGAMKAVENFRKAHGITEPYQFVDVCTANGGSYIGDYWWKKEKDVKVNYDTYLQWNATRHVASASFLQTEQESGVGFACNDPPRHTQHPWGVGYW